MAHQGALFDDNADGTAEPVCDNGYRVGEHVRSYPDGTMGAEALGIEHTAVHGVQGRGVLVDLFSRFGEFPRKEVGYDDLMPVLEADGAEIEAGDILCLWTGLDRMILRMKGEPDATLHEACAVLDGHDERLLQWISDSGVAAIVSDNHAIEAARKDMPEDHIGTVLPLHEWCLFRLGVPLGELWYLADLAAWLRRNERTRFLLTAPPLRLTGAVGSPVTPIATV